MRFPRVANKESKTCDLCWSKICIELHSRVNRTNTFRNLLFGVDLNKTGYVIKRSLHNVHEINMLSELASIHLSAYSISKTIQ
jgi:hypothetical protein